MTIKRHFNLRIACWGVLVAACTLNLSAAKFNRKVDIGQKAPEFAGLVGTDEKKHGLASYKDAKVLVVCFTCNHCPVATAYEKRLIALVNDYKHRGVALVAISVSDFPADRFEHMQQRATKHKFNFDYLYDPAQKTGRDYGATVTPHVFVLDRQRRIAYMGAFDDSIVETKIKHHYARDAVQALLAGQRPEVAESRQRGCPIEYSNR